MSDERGFLGDDYFDDDDEDTQKDRFLTFRIAKEEYAVAISCVIEVIGMQQITHVPDMPAFVKGVINLRGQVIPITDIRMRFKMDIREYDDRTCIIVVNVEDTFVGIVVDTVSDVLDMPEDMIAPPPQINQTPGSQYIQGLGKVNDDVKIILDVNKLLYEKRFELIDTVPE